MGKSGSVEATCGLIEHRHEFHYITAMKEINFCCEIPKKLPKVTERNLFFYVLFEALIHASFDNFISQSQRHAVNFFSLVFEGRKKIQRVEGKSLLITFYCEGPFTLCRCIRDMS